MDLQKILLKNQKYVLYVKFISANYRWIVYKNLVDVLLLVDKNGITHIVFLAKIQEPGEDQAIVRREMQLV